MNSYALFFIPILLAGLLVADDTQAQQPPCAERKTFLRIMYDNYKEVPTVRGLVVNGVVFEVWVSPTGSWSAMATRPDGITCAMFSGQAWQNVEPKAPDSEANQ